GVHRSNPKRRKPRQPARRAVDQVRVRHQPTDCQSARPRSAAASPATRRRGDRVKRREFITLVGVVAAWPLAAGAQQGTMPVVGFLNSTSLDGYRPMLNAFRQGLQQSGYIEGRNVAIEYRWAEGRNDRLPAMAAELVRHQVTVIVAMDTASVLAAQAATTTVPIVFYTGGDPVQL